MLPKILFVDDDPYILAAFNRQLRKLCSIETALGSQEGLKAVSMRGPFAVIVSDLRMPVMDGIQFFSHVRKIAPDSTRIMLTGNADMQTAIDAVNEGNIFRFLTKPCDQDVLIKSLQAGVRQHQLITAERILLEKTLRGSLKVLSEILELVNPEAFGRASRIAHCAREIAIKMQIADVWQIETAAALSQIGCVILSESALKKLYTGRELAGEDAQLFDMHPLIGSELIAHIPRMQGIAEIISNQEKHYDGSGIPKDARSGEEIPLGARILKVVLDFDILRATGITTNEALARLAKKTGFYDPEIVSALENVIGIEDRYEEKEVSVAELTDDMILAGDIRMADGRLLVARGYRVNRTLRERLKNFAEKPGVKEPLRVLVPR